jgi:hypothetical protein
MGEAGAERQPNGYIWGVFVGIPGIGFTKVAHRGGSSYR